MATLPTEIVQLILEQLWDSLAFDLVSGHTERVTGPAVAFLFGPLRVVDHRWLALVHPIWHRVEHLKHEEITTLEDLARSRYYNMDALSREDEVAALARWSAEIEERPFLRDVSMKLQQSENLLGTLPMSTLADEQLQSMAEVWTDAPTQQQDRVKTLRIIIEKETEGHGIPGYIRPQHLAILAQALPAAVDIHLLAEDPTELSGPLLEGGPWWKKLQHLHVNNFDVISTRLSLPSASPWNPAFTEMLQASSTTLKTLELLNCTFSTIDEEPLPLQDVMKGLTFPSLTKLSVLHAVSDVESPISADLFTAFPKLQELALTVGSSQDAAFLRNVPPSLTHLTLEIHRLDSPWMTALTTFITSHSSTLRYLSVDLAEARLEDPEFGPQASFFPLPSLQRLMQLCREHSILFATTDERTWGGSHPDGDGKMPVFSLSTQQKEDLEDGESSLGESEVQDEDDWDAEDWLVFAARWSEQKRRDMALGESSGGRRAKTS